jgi:hypothetical protein
MSVLEKLTEGIVERSLQNEGAALLEKWERTGLLEGLDNDSTKNGMARLLENQAAQLLKEASSMGAGDVQGFASVAFPLVRRVFGGLIANDLVSVQPMSLPSGLIFFMDFTYNDGRLGLTAGESLYGGGVVGSQVTGGVSDIMETGGGFYNLQNGYSSPTGSTGMTGLANVTLIASGAVGAAAGTFPQLGSAAQEALNKAVRFDADLSGSLVAVVDVTGSSEFRNLNLDNMIALDLSGGTTHAAKKFKLIRRLSSVSPAATVKDDPTSANFKLRLVLAQKSGSVIWDDGIVGRSFISTVTGTAQGLSYEFALADQYDTASALGSVVGSVFPLEGANNAASVGVGNNTDSLDVIPEINIKVDSVAVTAMTKKLKAKWTPELGQDLNAYHNLDAEVELTQILSEQIALEIDREIVNDLIQGATAGTYYWSRSPGLFVDRTTGSEIGANTAAPDFTGTVSEWYETLIETVNDVSAQIHRKTLRGGANFLVTSPEVANILEFTAGFRASITADADRGNVGAVNVGSISKKWDVWVDPYFPRNVILVGRKGGSFLESGYVYAPYVPLQVTPTIFGTEDFVPRKGVMTRYAKKMVRPDMYGLVVVRGLLGESGAG